MANICITLPKSIKWSDYEKELEKVKDGNEEMNFRLPTLPKDVHPGDRCYICHDGFVKGWMKITGIGKHDGFNCSTTGKEWGDGIYVSRSGEFHYLNNPIPMKGFQGYKKMDNLSKNFTRNTENNGLQEEVSVEPFEPKDELNPKFWVDNKLNSKVRMRLLDIADDFVKTLNIRWVKPDDIVLTGSIANYNWTKFSDVDIHIIMDFSKVYKKTDFVKSYFDAKKEEWNGSHDGLKIYGFNVELSVEDKNAPAVASGVYSLEKNDWVSEPKDLSDAKLNKEYVESTAETYIDKIDDLDRRIKKERDAKKIETLSNKMVSIFNKLKGMRKEGLKSKAKEMSSGNIIWKILRAEGYIKKIWDVVNYNYDRSMSLNEGYWGHLPLQNDYVLDDLHELAEENITPLVKELNDKYKKALEKDATPKKQINILASTDVNGKTETENHESLTSERYVFLEEIFQLINKIIYLIWSAAEWSPYNLEKEGIDIKKLLNNCIDILDDDVWIEGWKDGKKEEKKYLKKLKHWVELLIDHPYDKGKERYDQIKMGKELGFLHELNEAVTGKDNKNAAALYVYALDKPNGTWHILCAKRSNREGDEEGGKWNPPMGHLHRGEDMVDGAIRECLEESGVDFKAYHNKIKFMDGHRWGNNYRLIIKEKYTKDFAPGEGDEENDKFIWLPVEDINKKEWAWSCEENAEKYIPKTVTVNENQYKLIQESVDNETITLYHGVMTDKLEYNLENGGFTPRVCSEGGPKAVWLSEKQYNYNFTFKFEFPKTLLGDKLIQQSVADYTFTEFIPFTSFNCELVKTSFLEYDDNFSVEINLKDIEMCRRQMRFVPEIFHTFNNRMKKYPMVYKDYIAPVMQKLGVRGNISESKHTVIVNESQLEGIMPIYGTRYLNSYLKKFRERTGIENLQTAQLHNIMRLLNFIQKQPGCYRIEDIEYVLDRPDMVRRMLGMQPKENGNFGMRPLPDIPERKPDYTPPLSIMKNASDELLKQDDIYRNGID